MIVRLRENEVRLEGTRFVRLTFFFSFMKWILHCWSNHGNGSIMDCVWRRRRNKQVLDFSTERGPIFKTNQLNTMLTLASKVGIHL
jgi:hypothetical protein